MYRNTYIEVNKKNLEDNVRETIKEYPDFKYYFGVVKCNAYGHGDEVVDSFIEGGVNYLAVSSLEEAISIRKYNQTIPILSFGYIPVSLIPLAMEHNVSVSINSFSYFKELMEADIGDMKFHLKVNTGMNRLGVSNKEEIETIVNGLGNKLEGIYTHFATSGVMDSQWDNQIERWNELTSDIDLNNIPIVHLYNTMSLVKHPKLPFMNGVRLGLAMYGFSNSAPKLVGVRRSIFNIKKAIKLNFKKVSDTTVSNDLKLKKALSLYSEVIQITNIKRGEEVGYNAAFKALKDTTIATISIGHGDGIRNGFKHVIINDKLFNIVASTMDYIMVEVDENVKVNDKVTLIGERITVNEIARNSNTTVHHILVCFSSRVPIKYI